MALPADFSKIFGSTATGGLTPIGDVNYAKGWEFVGANPPTKNDFSYLQNLSDLKSQWLYSNKLQRTDPFGDIKSDGTVQTALENLGLGEAAKVSLGVDQNYVNVTSSRQSGVVYTNSTGKPILVSISVLNEQGRLSNSLLVGGTEVASTAVSPVSGAYSAVRSSMQAIVGNGKTYQLTGPGSVMDWSELR